jgi:hypothetical protein
MYCILSEIQLTCIYDSVSYSHIFTHNIFLFNQTLAEQGREDTQKQADEERAKFEVQMSVLNENLTTIRGDLVSTQTALEEASKLNDQLRGDKLGKLT